MAFARPRLFISYRRSDSEASAGRLADALVLQFGRGRVFLDSAKIEFGADFVRVVAAEIARADVVLVLIGPHWLDAADAQGRRLERHDDPVRYELELALRTGKRVLPVLLDGAAMPAAGRLPPPLAALATRNAATLRNAAFATDFDVLVDELLGRARGTLRTELDRLRRFAIGAGSAALLVPLLAGAAALGAWAGLFDYLHLDTHVQQALLARTPPPQGGTVLLVTIDAESEQRLARRWPVPRAAWRADHARLVERAAAAGARAVVFDLAFDCRTAGDPCAAELAALAAAARRSAQRSPPTEVVYGVREMAGGQAAGQAGRQGGGEAGEPRLAPVLRGSGRSGHVCLFDRGGGALWSVPLAVLAGDAGRDERVAAERPALAVAALVPAPLRAADLQRRVLEFDGPLRERPLRFSAVERRRDVRSGCPLIAAGELSATLLLRPSPAGHWQGAGRQASYASVLDPALLPDAALAGRVLLVGVTAGASGDVFAVQQGLGSRRVHGVELHAAAIELLAGGTVPRLATAGTQALSAAALALLGAALAIAVPRAWALAGAAAASAAVWWALCLALARRGLLLNPAYDLAALALTAALVHALLRLARRFAARGPT